MALVCDTKSETVEALPPSPPEEEQTETVVPDAAAEPDNEDLEDGEIEDDEEEESVPLPDPAPVEPAAVPPVQAAAPPQQQQPAPPPPPPNKFHGRGGRFERHRREEEKKRSHLTEAEKSVLHLHKLERIEREKRDRYKREQATVVDDFAINIEKAIANVLKKDKKSGDDMEEEEDKRGKKRKKRERDRDKKKQKRRASPTARPLDPNAEPDQHPDEARKERTRSPSPRSDYDSYESSGSSDKERKSRRARKQRPPSADRKNAEKAAPGAAARKQPDKDGQEPICLFYIQGKCNKGDECPYSHEVSVPMKLELCKFYLNECCAKGDKCLYMHSEFPCKFYHLGLRCQAGDACKFAHGRPLHEGLKQILYKHIETAPKEILGDFPRLTRDGTLNMINQAQKTLELKYDKDEPPVGRPIIPSLFEISIPMPTELKDDLKKVEKRERKSRWQDADPGEALQEQQKLQMNFGLKGFYSERDQDMRINSNGDIDMRTLPPPSALVPPAILHLPPPPLGVLPDETSKDVDIRPRPPQDIDIRQLPPISMRPSYGIPHFDGRGVAAGDDDMAGDEPNLQIVDESDRPNEERTEFPPSLPRKQRELFLRIQAQQKENVPEKQKESDDDDDRNNIDWYSDDDDDDNRLTIKDDEDKPREEEAAAATPPPPQPRVSVPIKPVEVIEKLGDLSKIDISEEVSRIISSISAGKKVEPPTKAEAPPRDPRLEQRVAAPPADPRRSRLTSVEKKPEKLSIYEQGSISLENIKDVDLRTVERDLDFRATLRDMDLRSATGRPDVDLRQMGLPFKAIQNYTPASEIDASINSHLPIPWKVVPVDIPRPDYTGLKLSAHDARSTGDPRLRKIFRLSTEEKESPASPKEKTVPTDPRRRRLEEKPDMNYAQQLTMLQSSQFYQSLTSNQKMLLNQELSTKNDQSGTNDATLNGILTNLGLLPGSSQASSSALNILANVNNMSMMPPGPFPPQMMPPGPAQQPGMLGPAPPAHPVPDFQLNFDPRQGGLLGNAPPVNYNDGYNNYNEDYYEGGGGNFEGNNRGGRGGRGGFRSHQRRGKNFNRNNRNFRNRNNNRANRSRTPP